MTWDLSKLGNCAAHGHHAGKVCPLCKHELAIYEPVPKTTCKEYDRSKWYKGPEKDLHEWLETELIRLGVSYVHGRMDKESTIRKGWPDFSCFFTGLDGVTRACFVELKSKTTPILKDQVTVISELLTLHIPVLVTGDFAEACDFIKSNLGMGITEPTI